MPNFRCHMLDEHGDILFPADIFAETVSAAIRRAFEILESNNLSPLSFRQVYAFEVWNGGWTGISRATAEAHEIRGA